MLDTDVAHDGLCLDIGPVGGHIEPYVVEGSLGLVYENEIRGAEDGYLPYDLASYSAGSAGDQYLLAFELLLYVVEVYVDFLAGKKVYDIHLLELGVVDVALAVPVLGVRSHAYADAAFDKAFDHALVVAYSVFLKGRDENGRGSGLAYVLADMVIVDINLGAHKIAAGHVGTVGNETGDGIRRVLAVADAFCETHAALTNAIDKNRLGFTAAVCQVVKCLYGDPHAPHKGCGQQGRQHEVAGANLEQNGRGTADILDDQDDGQANKHCEAYTLEVDKRREAYHSAISAEQAEAYDVENEIKSECAHHGCEIIGRISHAFVERKHGNVRYKHNQTVKNENRPQR